MERKLYKSRNDKVIDGVCGGLGEYFEIDPIIIRILWVIMVFFGGTGILAYIICMIVIPERPKEINSDDAFNDEKRYEDDYSGGERGMNDRSKIILGIGFVAIGGFILVDRYLPWFDFGFLWPFLLIGIGLYFLVGKRG